MRFVLFDLALEERICYCIGLIDVDYVHTTFLGMTLILYDKFGIKNYLSNIIKENSLREKFGLYYKDDDNGSEYMCIEYASDRREVIEILNSYLIMDNLTN